MVYRIMQFIWGITGKLSRSDMCLIDTYLSDYERKLFFMLPRNEQVHSVKVARTVISESTKQELYDVLLVRAAFMHDVGKINSGLNLVSKSILIILQKISPKFLLKLMKLRVVNAYYNHPKIALNYLDGEEEGLEYYVLNHHNYSISQDKKLKILQEADSNN